jgi:hypothetical protein
MELLVMLHKGPSVAAANAVLALRLSVAELFPNESHDRQFIR